MDDVIIFAICLYSGLFISFLVSGVMIFTGRNFFASVLSGLGVIAASMVVYMFIVY